MRKYDFIIITDSLFQTQYQRIHDCFNIIKDITGFNCILNPENINESISCNTLLYFADEDVKFYKVDKNIKFDNVSFINVLKDWKNINERNITIDMVFYSILYELFCKDDRLNMLSYYGTSSAKGVKYEYKFKNGIILVNINNRNTVDIMATCINYKKHSLIKTEYILKDPYYSSVIFLTYPKLLSLNATINIEK